jgi:hypothetical protein
MTEITLIRHGFLLATSVLAMVNVNNEECPLQSSDYDSFFCAVPGSGIRLEMYNPQFCSG